MTQPRHIRPGDERLAVLRHRRSGCSGTSTRTGRGSGRSAGPRSFGVCRRECQRPHSPPTRIVGVNTPYATPSPGRAIARASSATPAKKSPCRKSMPACTHPPSASRETRRAPRPRRRRRWPGHRRAGAGCRSASVEIELVRRPRLDHQNAPADADPQREADVLRRVETKVGHEREPRIGRRCGPEAAVERPGAGGRCLLIHLQAPARRERELHVGAIRMTLLCARRGR